MINIIDDDLDRCQAWVREEYQVEGHDLIRCIGLEQNGELVSVTGYNNFINKSCFAHLYVKRGAFIPRRYMWFVHYYPFEQADCDVMLAYLSNANTEIKKIAYHIGFKPITFIPETDSVIYIMKKENCRWLDLKIGEHHG